MNQTTLALALILLGVALCAPQQQSHEFPLDQLNLAACKVAEGRVTLGEWFSPAEGQLLSMEAEEGLDIVAEPPGGIEAPEASGGSCLVRVDRLKFPVRVCRLRAGTGAGCGRCSRTRARGCTASPWTSQTPAGSPTAMARRSVSGRGLQALSTSYRRACTCCGSTTGMVGRS